MPDTDSSNLFAYIHKVMMTHYINTQIQTVEWILIEKHTHAYIHSECILIENTYIHTYISIYEEGSLFCFVVMRSTDASDVFLVFLESSPWGEVHGLGLAVQKFLNIEWFLHWKLNQIVAKNFRGIGMCLWCCWKVLDEEDLMDFIW
jgi:hypothetical protein